IKELENEALTDSDINFIKYAGEYIAGIASYNDPDYEPWINDADDRMAIIADIHTDPNTEKVLEVATGNPYSIYVVVQDNQGNLRLTRGGTYSYFEFKQDMNNRLSDEEWHSKLDTIPPELPIWIQNSLPLISVNNINFLKSELLVNIGKKD
ncbi:MAG: DUF3160 domain-containing protein, partial [Candidatus Hodarchaeales archaeon]